MPQWQPWQRGGHRVLVGLLVAALAVVALGALSGCQLAFGPRVTINGVVYGEQIAARQAGKSVPMPLKATVTCNGTSTTANSAGAYSFSVPQSNAYTCVATAPNYGRITAKLKNTKAPIVLNYGPKPLDSCAHNDTSGVMTCGVVSPAPATLRGTVTDATTDAAIPNALVKWGRRDRGRRDVPSRPPCRGRQSCPSASAGTPPGTRRRCCRCDRR